MTQAAIDPADLLARFLALQAADDFSAALPLIAELAARLPDNARIHAFHGLALERLNRLPEAVEAYGRALARDGNYVDAAFNRACVLARLADPAAEPAFAAVLGIAPGHAGAQAALGRLRAERLQPRFAAALARERAGDPAGAEAAYRAILLELPDNVPVLQNLAVLIAPREPHEAIALWRRALALEPDNLELAASLGQFLCMRGQPAAALPYLESVIARQPFHVAIAELLQAKADLCDWTDLARYTGLLEAAVRDGVPVVPMAAVRFASDDPELPHRAGKRFLTHVLARSFPSGITPRTHMPPGPGAPRPERLVIGYVSSDMRNHIIGILLAALLEHHDRSRFEIQVFSLARREDAVTERIRGAVDRFERVADLTPTELAASIAAGGVDIAIDLNGWTRDGQNEALALRPAPVQLQWLGYPATSGGGFIDYVIADGFTVPPGSEGVFTERMLRLPLSHQPFDRDFAAGPVPSREGVGLPDDALVLAALQPHWKITPPIFEVWMRILRQIPDAVLWLVEGGADARRNLRAAAAAAGIAPDRLLFARKFSMAEFPAALALADIFVDTFPYSGHSTTSCALFAGLPVVSLAGRSFASRVAGSVLQATGLAALVTHDLTNYEGKILELAQDRAALGALRQAIRRDRATAPFFDPARFVRDFERGCETAWENWRDGLPPRHITIEEA